MTEGKIVVCPQCGKKYKLKVGFNAASFSCNACSATVWVKKRSAAAPTSGRSRRPAGRRKAAGGRGGAPARGRRRRQEPAQDQAEGGRYSSRYGGKKDNSATVIMAIVGVVVIGVIIFFAVSSGGEKQEQTAMVPPVTATDGCGETDVDVNTGNDGGDEEDLDLSGGTTEPAKAIGDPAEDATDGDARPSADTTPAKKLGGSRKKRASDGRKSRWDPPADLEHLEGTSPEDRKRIDDLITTMIDVFAGKDSLDAKQTLIALGKPAFPRILGAMAKIRDTITDVDSDDERLIESSLKLADECLREMDGWLTAKQKSTLRPGSEKRYIGYICRLHYKRWMLTLRNMPEMPGPFDPSGDYAGDAEEFK